MKVWCAYRVRRCVVRSSGFTLIELLVVISIIMVLSGLLFPAFSRARATARQTACISNLRQCGMALQMYRDDNDGQYPPQNLSALDWPEGPGPRRITGPEEAIWVGQLYRYLRNWTVMRCSTANTSIVDSINGMPFGVGINILLTHLTEPSLGGG